MKIVSPSLRGRISAWHSLTTSNRLLTHTTFFHTILSFTVGRANLGRRNNSTSNVRCSWHFQYIRYLLDCHFVIVVIIVCDVNGACRCCTWLGRHNNIACVRFAFFVLCNRTKEGKPSMKRSISPGSSKSRSSKSSSPAAATGSLSSSGR